MYSKECAPSSQCAKNANVPVQSFDAGPSLEEFARRNAAEQTRVIGTQYAVPNQSESSQNAPAQDCKTEQKALECTGCKSTERCCNSKKILGNIEADDLLLLLLIFLMICDKDANSDFVIPILLAVLLLF